MTTTKRKSLVYYLQKQDVKRPHPIPAAPDVPERPVLHEVGLPLPLSFRRVGGEEVAVLERPAQVCEALLVPAVNRKSDCRKRLGTACREIRKKASRKSRVAN